MPARAPRAITIAIALLSARCGDDPAPTPQPWVEAFAARELGWLLSAWGPSSSEIYAVGGTPDRGLIMRFDGTSWSSLPLPPDVPLINWSYGFGSNDVTFVGARGTILHYDGASFTRLQAPTEEDLWGVWGAAPDDLWAVGGRGMERGQATILHYDGAGWTRSSTPALSRPSVYAFFKVWGTSADNVYAVGQRGALARWDGVAWSEVESGTGEDLIALWGTGPDNITVVGGRGNGQLVTFDGATWRHRSLAPLAGLNGVWMRDPGKVHVAGSGGTIATIDLETFERSDELTGTFLELHALFGSPDGTLYAVGGSLLTIEPPHQGIALERRLVEGE